MNQGFEQTPSDKEDLESTAELLRGSRPIPAPAFRGDLKRRLMGERGAAADPRGSLGLAFGFGSLGSLLLLVATLGVIGLGPLAA